MSSLRLWSFHTLGRYFTLTIQTSSDQPVIADGPYRLIRHPSYAGLLLIIMAVGLFIGNWEKEGKNEWGGTVTWCGPPSRRTGIVRPLGWERKCESCG